MKDLPSTLKHLTLWLVLGTGVMLAVLAVQRHQASTRWQIGDGRVELLRSADGHYHWPGHVNGRPVEFLVDTGASSTTLPAALAQELGLETQGNVRSHTAGGVVTGTRARIDLSLAGGLDARGLVVNVLPALDRPLLGMDVLSRMRLVQQDGRLQAQALDGTRGR